MKKFFLAFLAVLMMVSCTNMSTKQLVPTLRNSIGNDIDEIGQVLVDHGFTESSRSNAKHIIYEHGDTIVHVIASMSEWRNVGGAYVAINCSSAEKALAQYHEFRDLCREEDKFYGSKIIKIYAKTPEEALFSSTDPLTIDTISAAYIEANDISTINERWEDGGNTDNRTVVAMFRNQFGTWTVTAIFRSEFAYPE